MDHPNTLDVTLSDGRSWYVEEVDPCDKLLLKNNPRTQSYFSHHEKWSCREDDGEGNGTPLQYFCLENPMDGGAW